MNRQNVTEMSEIEVSPRRRFLVWMASFGFGAALVGAWGGGSADRRTESPLEPGRAGHDPCLDPGAPRGREKELS